MVGTCRRIPISFSILVVHTSCVLAVASPSTKSLFGSAVPLHLPDHLHEPTDSELLKIVGNSSGNESMELRVVEVVASPFTSGSTVLGKHPTFLDKSSFQVFSNGYCAVNHAWTPGDHGCQYIQTAEDCAAAAAFLGISSSLGVNNSLGGMGSGNANSVLKYSAQPSLSWQQPRGCLAGAQARGNGSVAVLFAEGYGTAACGVDGLACICDCKSRRSMSDEEDVPEPEQVAFLAAATFTLIAMVFVNNHMSQSILTGCWSLVAVSMM